LLWSDKYEEGVEGRGRRRRRGGEGGGVRGRRRRRNKRKKNLAEVATPVTYSGDIPVRIQTRN